MLFLLLRDRESQDIKKDKTITIVEGGQVRSMNIEALEEKFMEDYPQLLTCQASVPDQLIHEDQIRVCTDKLIPEMQDLYEKNLEAIFASLKKDYPKKKEQELLKQAENQAKAEMLKSRDAQLVASRLSLEAEDSIQKATKNAAKFHSMPITIFRGVNTFHDICKYLEDFGIRSSKLKNFSKPSPNSTQECEHDIAVVALTKKGPVVTFIQVFI